MSEYQVNSLNKKENGRFTAKNMALSERVTIIVASLLSALLYTICFTGKDTYPNLSFFVFCCAAVAIMYAALRKLQYIVDKRAFILCVPILIISSFNAVFQLNLFSYANVIMIHILFATMGYAATRGEAAPVDVLRVCCGNIPASLDIYKSTIGKGRHGSAAYIITRVLAGFIIAAPILAVIMMFLLDADAVFKRIVYDLYDSIIINDFNMTGHLLCIAIVSVYLSGYAYNMKRMNPSGFKMPSKALDTIIGVTFLVLINIIFLFFCIIQMVLKQCAYIALIFYILEAV